MELYVPMEEDFKILHIARVIDQDEFYLEIAFFEFARFFRLEKSNPDFKIHVRILRDAEKSDSGLNIRFSHDQEDLIKEVRAID